MSETQMVEAARMGAYIEFVYNGVSGGGKQFEFADYARTIRRVGVDHCILSGDMGQPRNPLHPDGLLAFYRACWHRGSRRRRSIGWARKIRPG